MRTLILIVVALYTTAVFSFENQSTLPPESFEVAHIGTSFPSGTHDNTFHEVRLVTSNRTWSLELTGNSELIQGLNQQFAKSIRGQFFRGQLVDYPESWVRLSLVGHELSGVVFDGTELWLVEDTGFETFNPALEGNSKQMAKELIVYRARDLHMHEYVDDGGHMIPMDEESTPVEPQEKMMSQLKDIAKAQGASMLALPVTIVTDVEFNRTHGELASAVVMERVNIVDGIFTEQIGISIQLEHLELLQDNDVLTSTDPSILLNGDLDANWQLPPEAQPGFAQFLNGGAGKDIPVTGLAHLFTGKNLNGNVLGKANMGGWGSSVVCSREYGIGVNQSVTSDVTSALVFAHELGHNFNACHDNDRDCGDYICCPSGTESGIMTSPLNGSQFFSECSLNMIEPALSSASCLKVVSTEDKIFGCGFGEPT